MEEKIEATVTLNQALRRLGYITKPGSHGRKEVFDAEGYSLGEFTAHDCWEFLRSYHPERFPDEAA